MGKKKIKISKVKSIGQQMRDNHYMLIERSALAISPTLSSLLKKKKPVQRKRLCPRCIGSEDRTIFFFIVFKTNERKSIHNNACERHVRIKMFYNVRGAKGCRFKDENNLCNSIFIVVLHFLIIRCV